MQTYQKSLFLVGHPLDGTAVQDDDLRMSFLPSLSSASRSMDQVSAFTPLLNYLSDSEIDRNEKEREKELNRRRKRNTRGRRGIALPDREPPKTFRTPAIGFPEMDPAALALAQAAAAPTSRRAAAAAASVTIANMVASENGTAVVTPTLPMATPAPAPAQQKEKKPKGLFRPPKYPDSVINARAHVVLPTPWTAADASKLPPPLENDPPVEAAAPPDSRVTRVITAKRAKELEREAKEKEFADGQHANMIDGVWHCSNCGCPEDIAIGRRKGPLGDKSQCGMCGESLAVFYIPPRVSCCALMPLFVRRPGCRQVLAQTPSSASRRIQRRSRVPPQPPQRERKGEDGREAQGRGRRASRRERVGGGAGAPVDARCSAP